MQEYIFKENAIEKNLNIIFLCGVKYSAIKDDKRNVLREFISNLDSINHVVILEENFIFGRSNKKFLAYDDIFMNDLSSVETLTAMFSDIVFIIHESNSTAAELGMFATNEQLKGKLCLLVPNEFSIEENKMSAFLTLAFFRKRSDIGKIIFYPSTKVWRLSNNKSDFRTQFVDNQIGINLSKNIKNFINNHKVVNLDIKFVKAKYGKYSNQINILTYSYSDSQKSVNIRISAEILKLQIISLFNIDGFRTEIRKNKTISEHITYVTNYYKEILKNTLEVKEGYNIEKVNIFINGTTIDIRKSVAYLFYLLQAINKIRFIQEGKDPIVRKIRIDNDFAILYEKYQEFIAVKGESEFGGINL